MQKKAHEEHPIRNRVRELCKKLVLSADFSEDTSTLSTLNNQGLIAVRCVLSHEGKPIGVGHGSSILSRINRGNERTVFGCFNGALMSAINSACKTLDLMRLEAADTEHTNEKSALAEAYHDRGDYEFAPATEKQKSYARQLISLNVDDEADREQIASTLDGMSKDEISGLIQRLAR